MGKGKKNILIVGQGAIVSALAKKLRTYGDVGEIFAAPGNTLNSDIYTNIDIREKDLTELLKFVLENNIELTIPVTNKAIKSDIVSFFQSNGQAIFGPNKDSANITLNNAYGKKFLYKIHAQTSKFGIFDKLQQAEIYLKDAEFPVTIKCSSQDRITDGQLVCPTISLATEYLSTLFSKNETDILIEEFTYGPNFTVYFVTDGYTAIPITTVANYKFTHDGDGGILTNGIGCYAPNFKISQVILSRVQNIAQNTLKSLEKKGEPYVGILGIECVLTGEDKFYVEEFKPFFQEHDATAVLNLIDDNLLNIFTSCINGFFSDDYEEIKTNNLSSVSAIVLSRHENKEIKGLDIIEDINNIDFINVKKDENIYLTQKDEICTLTRTASTLSRAKTYLYEDLAQINFEGIKFRKDICQSPKGEC